jgi:Ca2+-binding RTX toxin-like protein
MGADNPIDVTTDPSLGGESGYTLHGSGEGGDTIDLVFTAQQLSEALSDPFLHGQLTGPLTGGLDTLLLHGPFWSVEAQDFDDATLNVDQFAPHATYHTELAYSDDASGNDTGGYLVLGDGSELIPAGAEADLVHSGDDGNDLLLGGLGHDILSGGHSDDLMLGAFGGDALGGGGGKDVLAGGEGADTFVLSNVQIGDLIADFNQGGGITDLSALFDPTLSGSRPDSGSLSLETQGSPSSVHLEVANITLQIDDGTGHVPDHSLA